jgi:putative transposase
VSKHESTTPASSVTVQYLRFKYRIYPTRAQVVFLEGQLRDACDLYNAALQERRDAWRICRKSINFYDQDRQIKPMRADGCLKIVNSKCARDVLRRVDLAFLSFFRRCKTGEKPGYPRFRSFRRYDSLTFPRYGNGCRFIDNKKIHIQSAGHVKIKLHRPIEGDIRAVTIKREAGKWFASFVASVSERKLPLSSTTVGIDVGLTAFAALSDGTEIQNPRHYRKAQAKLRRAGRKVSRRKKGSNRRRKAVLELQRAHAHVKNQRADFLHKESRKIVNQFGTIAVEDLNVKGLASGMLAKSVHDAGWAIFFLFLMYKAEWAGREFVKVDPRGTSQTCLCGASVPKILKDRWHKCTACGREGPRDRISAEVILQRAGNRPSGANVRVGDLCVA